MTIPPKLLEKLAETLHALAEEMDKDGVPQGIFDLTLTSTVAINDEAKSWRYNAELVEWADGSWEVEEVTKKVEPA